jgi:predicted HTH transcriptional regulator
MDILNKLIESFKFEDVVAFCKKGYREGFQLDYKREYPSKGLSKHIVALSNSRGGVIIIGVEEDDKTGFPKGWDGIDMDAKLIEKLHQEIANVEPFPSCIVHATDSKDGKFFILVRVLAGDSTPYYVQNDSNVYVRTGNITTPIDIASPDGLELMFGKREKAEKARENYITMADDIFDAKVMKKGVSLGHIQVLLGHSDIQTTSRHYLGILSDDEAKQAHEKGMNMDNWL